VVDSGRVQQRWKDGHVPRALNVRAEAACTKRCIEVPEERVHSGARWNDFDPDAASHEISCDEAYDKQNLLDWASA
jgi:hypothetical protein